MQRECALTKQFCEHKDWTCENERKSLCDSMNCVCGCRKIASVARMCRENYFDNTDYQFLTVFDMTNDIQLGQLAEIDVVKIKRQFLLKMRRLNIPGLKLIGGFDVEQQDYIDEHRNRKSRWLPHMHCFIISDLTTIEMRNIIYKKFNRGQTKRVAYQIQGNDEPYGCTYLFKAPDGFKKKLASTEKGQMKQSYPIRGRAKKELNEFLMCNNRLDWLMLIGLRRYGDKIIPI